MARGSGADCADPIGVISKALGHAADLPLFPNKGWQRLQEA